ncbi:MAG: cytochrome c oxidase subunit II [Caldilineales bacterium]|nr:cytochrome c oxidase subunit II [Caldilineales bacterium]
MKHVINVIVLIVLLTLILLFAVNQTDWMPVAASAQAGPIDWLFGLHLDVITFLYVMVNVILFYSVFAFRRKKDDDSEGAYFSGNSALEILWTFIPLVVVMYFAFLGTVVLREVTAAAPNEMTINVTARQWSWSIEYPDLGEWNDTYAGERIAATELNVPVGQPINFILNSEDVTHNFWVPEWRVKQDTVPGQEKNLRVTPTEEGQYKIRCAELCGTSHAYMLANINVMSAEDFDIWVQQRLGIYVAPEGGEGEGVDPVAQGQQIAQSAGCTACHSVDGSVLVGPSWQGLFGKTENLEDGSSVTVDEAYLHESIVDPAAKIVAGFANVMPNNYGDTLTEAEIGYLIEYIKSL